MSTSDNLTFRDHAARLGRVVADDHNSDEGRWEERITIDSARFPGKTLVMEVCVNEQDELRIVWGYGGLEGEEDLIRVTPTAARSEAEMWRLVAWTGDQIAKVIERV